MNAGHYQAPTFVVGIQGCGDGCASGCASSCGGGWLREQLRRGRLREREGPPPPPWRAPNPCCDAILKTPMVYAKRNIFLLKANNFYCIDKYYYEGDKQLRVAVVGESGGVRQELPGEILQGPQSPTS